METNWVRNGGRQKEEKATNKQYRTLTNEKALLTFASEGSYSRRGLVSLFRDERAKWAEKEASLPL